MELGPVVLWPSGIPVGKATRNSGDMRVNGDVEVINLSLYADTPFFTLVAEKWRPTVQL